MRILWISCLLIGSITCTPAWKVQQTGESGQAGTGHMAQSAPGWGSGLGGSSSLSSPSYGGGYGAGGYDGSGGSYGYGAGSYGGAGWNSGSTSYQAEDAGPFFSDVSDLDPIYSFGYRSRYQRGRAVFAQSRYTPGEPLVEPMPIYRPVIKNPVILEIPVQDPVKQQTKQIQVRPQTQQGYVQQGIPTRFQTKGGY